MSRPEEERVEHALLEAVGDRGEEADVAEHLDVEGDVLVRRGRCQSVAQYTELFSAAVCWTWLEAASSELPSRPWP